MHVQLPTDLEQFVNEQVAAGRFPSADDVVREGLRLLRQQDDLRRDIAVGIEQADRGAVALFSAADVLQAKRPRKH